MDPKAVKFSVSPDEVDRISKLPDEILIHILSYLPTEDSVCTRILSKRWKYLFTLVPVLNFFGPEYCSNPATIKSFLDFVNFVLNSYNVDHMDTFSYISHSNLPEPEGSRLISWIQNIVNQRVRVLYIKEQLETRQTLPQNVLTSETLTVLKLHGNFYLEVPDNMGLPRLKTLDLMDVTYFDDNLMRRLIRSCPVLEELFLYNCSMQNSKVIDICSPSLLRLRIHGFQDEYELILDVPNVRYLEYHGDERVGISGISVRGELKSLVDASISFTMWDPEDFEPSSKLVSAVSHVQTVRLCAYTLQGFEVFDLPLPTFHNLTTLEMSMNGGFDFDMELLVDLLDKTPHLDFLGLDNMCADMYGPTNTLELERVPMCVSTHLKVIEFRGFSMLYYERMLVEYFLKTAKVLKKLYIRLEGSLEEQFVFSQELLAFSRCSRACQVILDTVREEEEEE